MKRQFKAIASTLAFFLIMVLVGRVSASALLGQYTANTLYGQPYGEQWSPTYGVFRVQVDNDGGDRIVTASGQYVEWNQQAIDWLRIHYSNNVAITTHSFKYSDSGCSSFEAHGGFTTLPAPQVTTHMRQCWPSYATEVRMASTNPWSLSPSTYYYGDSYYSDSKSTVDQKFTIDTYWGGYENWHKTFCVWGGNYYPSNC